MFYLLLLALKLHREVESLSQNDFTESINQLANKSIKNQLA